MAAAPVLPASPAPTPDTAPLSQGARIVDTFIAPSKTFTDLRRSASWWAPWLVIAFFSLIFVYAMSTKVGFEQISKTQVEHSSRADQFDKLPADQQAKQIQLSSKIVGFFAYGSPFLILFYALIATVVLWLTFKLGAGAETTFGQAYAGVNPEGFDVNNPVGTNLAYYLDPETTGKFVRGMASSLDVLSIWTIVLLGIGFACTSKVKRSTAIIIVAVWYLVFKLTTSALASL
jgi:hypothetical protein